MPRPFSTSSTPSGDPVMVARFAVPVLPATYVRRPRLVGRLAEGVRGPLVLVTGPAGAGKTLLVADWFRAERGRAGRAGRAVWLTLERPDDDPGLFWAYVLQALQHHGVELPADITAPAEAGEADQALLGRLAAHLQAREPSEQPVVLVLDEFERIGSPEIAAGLHELLRHAGLGLRLVLVSRTEPLLPLHRYRVSGELTSLRAADLAFSADDSVALFGAHGLAVSEESVRALTARMAGWAAGLRLAALAAPEAPDAEACLRDFEAGQSTIADFLTNEVFTTQPAPTQDLLLRTCILDQVHPDLADALTGRRDGARILADLYRANAFVTPVGHSWYRHHPLFAEIVRIRLHVWQPGLERELHARAARWLGEHGQPEPALAHAAEAEDWEFAATLLVRSLAIGRLLEGRDAERLCRLFAAMPPQTPGPAPALVRAALALAGRDADQAVHHLRDADEALRDADRAQPLSAQTAALRLTGACLRVLAARLHGSADSAEAAAEEAAGLRAQLPRELVDEHPELSAHLMGDLGAVLLRDGRFDEASRALVAAAEAPDAPGTAQLRHESLSWLGLIDVLDGRLARAEARARAAVTEAERSGLRPGTGTRAGQLVLAEVAIDRGELDAADAELRRADAASADRADPVVTQELSVARSRLMLAKGEPAAALHALQEGEKAVPEGAGSPWLADRVAATASTALLAAGRPDAAIDALCDADPQAPEPAVASARARLACGQPETALRDLGELGPRHGPGSVVDVQALLTRAQAADALGDPAGARRLVRRALAAADAERLWLPFRLASPWLRRVLRGDEALTRPYAWLPSDLRPARSYPPGAGAAQPGLPVVVEPLTGREHEVLARAAELMSTEEIAADLHLSVNTVKTHLKSINRKLGAGRRGEAVRRARMLKLL
ncbi:LuxR C-terminal-related transcriptional regulator [Streptacidiphilus neutrinimicus]|uniref:LuxR C-terminal-related transcriptional regulator n=1 Tax=Streptacidiphilus neutrinimicus TaxID=105420 RepID=UPI0005A5DE88|nr:LuxR C-terminal-related transcriptional regulator [Streptacidiphilus neutrinimicus]